MEVGLQDKRDAFRHAAVLTLVTGNTDVKPDSNGQNDFLERERALLGDDATLFNAGDRPTVATVQDGDDDLLGGDDDFKSTPAQASGMEEQTTT